VPHPFDPIGAWRRAPGCWSLVAQFVERNSQAADSRPDDVKNARRHRWVLLGLSGLVFVVFGIVLVAITDTALVRSSSNPFCGTFCHSMIWAWPRINEVRITSTRWESAPVAASVISPMTRVALLRRSSSNCFCVKADRGAKDFWNESHKTIATDEEWEKRRPLLRTTFENYLTSHNYITCRGCHRLDSFGGPRSQMKVIVHKDVIKAAGVDCLQCHRNVGHVYEQGKTKDGGWYTEEQATAGGKTYAQSCVPCHGANLEGGPGPSLKGASWQQLYKG
jgi:nitrate/TMAO reductase-like tetraheme cytochrome c subunit